MLGELSLNRTNISCVLSCVAQRKTKNAQVEGGDFGGGSRRHGTRRAGNIIKVHSVHALKCYNADLDFVQPISIQITTSRKPEVPF